MLEIQLKAFLYAVKSHAGPEVMSKHDLSGTSEPISCMPTDFNRCDPSPEQTMFGAAF